MPIAYTTTGRALTLDEQWTTFTCADTGPKEGSVPKDAELPRQYGVGDFTDCGHNLDGYKTWAEGYASGNSTGLAYGRVPPDEHMATWKWRTLIENSGFGGHRLAGNGEHQCYAKLENQKAWNPTGYRWDKAPTHEVLSDPTATNGKYMKFRAHRVAPEVHKYEYDVFKAYNPNNRFVSAMLNGYRSIERQYGMWEGRFRFHAAHAYWPAFWLMPADAHLPDMNLRWPPEIDIFEYVPFIAALNKPENGSQDPFNARDSYNIGILTRNTDPEQNLTGFQYNKGTTPPHNIGLDDGQWHTFACLITPTKTAFYLDSVNVREVNTPTSYTQSYEHPGQPRWWFPIINIAVGSELDWQNGSWCALVDNQKFGWTNGYGSVMNTDGTGPYPYTTPNLLELDIDYIRHWDATAAEGGPYFTGNNSNGPIVISHGGVLTPNGTPVTIGAAGSTGGSGGGTSGTGTGTPINVSVGSGAKTLVIKVSQDFYLSDAQYTVSVDGTQIGTVLTASARHGSGSDTVSVFGDWAPGSHTLAVNFLNDAYGGAGLDRNLYVDGITYQGATVTPGTASFLSSGPVEFSFTDSTSITPTAGPLIAPVPGATLNSNAINTNLKHCFIPSLSRPATTIAQFATSGSATGADFGSLGTGAGGTGVLPSYVQDSAGGWGLALDGQNFIFRTAGISYQPSTSLPVSVLVVFRLGSQTPAQFGKRMELFGLGNADGSQRLQAEMDPFGATKVAITSDTFAHQTFASIGHIPNPGDLCVFAATIRASNDIEAFIYNATQNVRIHQANTDTSLVSSALTFTSEYICWSLRGTLFAYMVRTASMTSSALEAWAVAPYVGFDAASGAPAGSITLPGPTSVVNSSALSVALIHCFRPSVTASGSPLTQLAPGGSNVGLSFSGPTYSDVTGIGRGLLFNGSQTAGRTSGITHTPTTAAPITIGKILRYAAKPSVTGVENVFYKLDTGIDGTFLSVNNNEYGQIRCYLATSWSFTMAIIGGNEPAVGDLLLVIATVRSSTDIEIRIRNVTTGATASAVSIGGIQNATGLGSLTWTSETIGINYQGTDFGTDVWNRAFTSGEMDSWLSSPSAEFSAPSTGSTGGGTGGGTTGGSTGGSTGGGTGGSGGGGTSTLPPVGGGVSAGPAPTFVPPRQPDPGLRRKPKLNVLEARYGDGYSQRARPGINSISENVSLTWSGLPRDQAVQIETFLRARGGSGAFWWTPPPTWPVDAGSRPGGWPANPGPILVTCAEFERAEIGPNLDTVTASFRQEFDPGA